MTPTERLRALLRDKMTSHCEHCGMVVRMALREAAPLAGTTHATLNRFLNGASIDSDTFDAISKWVESA